MKNYDFLTDYNKTIKKKKSNNKYIVQKSTWDLFKDYVKDKSNRNRIIIFVVGVIVAFFVVCLIFKCCSAQPEDVKKGDGFPVTVQVKKSSSKYDVESMVAGDQAAQNRIPDAYNEQLGKLRETKENNSLQFAGDSQPEQEALDNLNGKIADLEKDIDASVHIVMFDLNSCTQVTYQADDKVPTASAIKLPYVASLLDMYPNIWDKEKNSISNILAWSDNNSYFKLRKKYGVGNLQKWCDDLKITSDMCSIDFPENSTPRDMALLWTKAYYFLHTYSHSKEICKYLTNSKQSFFYPTLNDKYTVHSKPGWWDGAADTENGVHYKGITADCGVIHADNNPYVCIVYIEAYKSSNGLKDLVLAIDDVHNSIYKRNIVCNTQEELDAANKQNENSF